MARGPDAEDDLERILLGPSQSNGLERRVSRKSSRPSTRSLRPARPPSPKEQDPDQHSHHAAPRPPSPRNIGHNRHLSAPLGHRRRLSSIHRPDVAQSPLASIFQPLVLDDVLEPEESTSDGASSALLPYPQLGYSPATRRRLGSAQSVRKRPSNTSLWGAKPTGSGRPAFPPLDTRAETLSGALSSSPDLQEEVGGIATAEQAEEQAEENGGMAEWMKRMERIEGRQERIEDLLVQLHAQLQR